VKRASLIALLLATQAHGATPVRGTVRTLLRPLGGVTVVVPEAGRFSVTDSLGRFDLGVLPPGLHALTLAAVGYEAARGTVTVLPDSTAPESDWLMKPLRPDGQGATAFPAPSPTWRDSSLADSLTSLPGPGPIAPPMGLFLTAEEKAERGMMPGALGELLPQISTADSITFDSGGTGAPGPETWNQWSERIAPQSLGEGATAVLARRTLAYTRTRAAIASGPNWNGWQASKTARTALAGARKDTDKGAPGAAFLDALAGRLDATFVAGTEPAKPVPARPKKRRKAKK
jgi:hypothetical protein